MTGVMMVIGKLPWKGVQEAQGTIILAPFILPKIWTINDFLPKMSEKVFNNLRDRYQIPDHIPIRLPSKFEKCYSGKTADVGMYDTMFAAGPRLPLMALHPSVRPHITGEQEAFICWVLEIPLDECTDVHEGALGKLRGKLDEETRQKEKEQEAKVAMKKELTALLGQVEMTRADAVAEFKASQPFIDSCAVYYGDGFKDCLKQVQFVYLHLDRSPWVTPCR
ncbi:hypothetical protein SO802_023267 [Lithocarpus litseifolius]|uniref:Uncharacterized protein n=1 Tax=Lithocarpus litseifolius TaxID=425828 RepID=A0AAW2C5W5_9ROSI